MYRTHVPCTEPVYPVPDPCTQNVVPILAADLVEIAADLVQDRSLARLLPPRSVAISIASAKIGRYIGC